MQRLLQSAQKCVPAGWPGRGDCLVLHLGWLEAELAPDLDLAGRVCKVAIGVIDRTERRIIGTGFITEIFIASEKNINSSYQVPGGENIHSWRDYSAENRPRRFLTRPCGKFGYQRPLLIKSVTCPHNSARHH